MKRIGILVLILGCVGVLLAHPHFQKEITVDLPGTKVTLHFQTVPANEEHVKNVPIGGFITPRGPQLNLSAGTQAGSVSIPAGDYTVGVIRKAQNDWAVALFPGRLGRGQTPTESELIVLDSMFSDHEGMAEHLRVDITPGHGKLEGHATLLIEFGSLSCFGAIT